MPRHATLMVSVIMSQHQMINRGDTRLLHGPLNVLGVSPIEAVPTGINQN